MPTTLSRELSITYGSYVVGGAQTGRILESWYYDESTPDTAVVGFTFLIRATTEALFNAAIAAAETAFKTRWQNLTITQGSETLKTFSHSGDTGFNASPSIVKVEDEASTGRSRRYKIRISFDLPASDNSLSGRRMGRVDVNYSPSRVRTVTFTGTWTAVSGTSARSQYESAFSAWKTTILNALGGTYKLLEEPSTQQDSDNKLLDFVCTYEEIIMTGVGSGDAAIREERLVITRDEASGEDSPINGRPVDKLVTLTAKYEASVDATSSTDLKSKWSSLRASVVSKLKSILDGGSLAIIQEVPDYDMTANKMIVTLTCMGTTKGGVVEYQETIGTTISPGEQGVGWWTGSPYAKHVFQGPGSYRRKVVQSYLTFGPTPAFSQGALQAPGGMQSYKISDDTQETPISRGLSGGSVLTMRRVTRTVEVEFYTVSTSRGSNDVPTFGHTPEGMAAWNAAAQANPPR